MTIEIHQPELEALIQERMASGHFVSVEEFLRQALEPSRRFEAPEPTHRMTLREAFEAGRGLGEGLDTTRNPSFARPVEL